jgi:LysR family transcriptional regulator (chromosome initiation inhibitor)
MQIDYPLLETLAAVVRDGTFEAAARSLNISEAVVRQRVDLLEERTGAVLVVRNRPCVATEYGLQLCRHLDQVQLLEEDLWRSLTPLEGASSDTPAVVRVAVNRDSLATWFPEVIQYAGSELNLHFEVIPDDQEHTAEKLRTGEAMAAITSETEPLPGCRRIHLGAIEYIAVASEKLMMDGFRNGVTIESLAKATYLVFDRKDTLPLQWTMTAFGMPARLRGHWMPSYSGYMACCLNGAGWGMMPRYSVQRYLDHGSLVEFFPGTSVVVPLYWVSSTPNSRIMKTLSSMVEEIAQKHLLPPSAKNGGVWQ